MQKITAFLKIIFLGYATTLEMDISEDILGSHRDFLLKLLKANRSSAAASKIRTQKLVDLLHIFEISGNEVLLNRINAAFATESYEQLKQAFDEYILEKRGNIEELSASLTSGHREALEIFCKKFLKVLTM